MATRNDPPAPIQALAIDDDGTVQARSLHLPRGEPVRLEVRAMTPIVLTVEGTDTELLVHPGTTFLHVRVAESAATALIATRASVERSSRIPIVLEDPEVHRARAEQHRPRHAPAACGELLFASKGCAACHLRAEVADGGLGGSLEDLRGATRTFTDGSMVVLSDADTFAAYLRESITSPHARVVAGRTDVMPAIALSTDEVQALVAYIECLARPCETLSCAAVCDDGPVTLAPLGPHGTVSGCELQ